MQTRNPYQRDLDAYERTGKARQRRLDLIDFCRRRWRGAAIGALFGTLAVLTIALLANLMMMVMTAA